ncbi:MAG TPA: maltotransferase domain-containing protein, partial [Thermoanaerobaculia bacterium]
LLYKHTEENSWKSMRMESRHNDHWAASFRVEKLGRYQYTVRGWSDPFLTWQRDLVKRQAAGQDLTVDLQIGSELFGERIEDYESAMKLKAPLPAQESIVLYEKVLEVVVDPVRARFSSWYEMFPRSFGGLRGLVGMLPYVESLGFNVLYLPPVHPIGTTARKGRNNAVSAQPGDVGSPWAIGSKDGGHKAIEPSLGTFEDFDSLVKEAKARGIDVALDIAFQCSPDHPYVREHPEWFRARPDGTIQYAENPPKKYQDIYPFDFETEGWRELWRELKSVFDFWIGQGVKIFRVDNPHTKPFPFWEWAITEIKKEHPDVLFLSEAFTRPKIMYRLAKLGFTQSYNYFPWRNRRWELVEYFTELTQTEVREFFRPNLWPNTPDILTEPLQIGGRPAFVQRLMLAATLGASYGLYGPAYELMEHVPRERGSEEYLDSEKYQLRQWDLTRPDSLSELIGLVNRIRRENPALQSDQSLRFHTADNEQILCYSKAAGDNVIVVAVNLDPNYAQAAWVELDLSALGLAPDQPFQVHDLLTGARYLWHGSRNFVRLDPHQVPAHIFRVRRRVRSERDFDYFI